MKNIFSGRRHKNPHHNESFEKSREPFFSKENKAPFFNSSGRSGVQAKLSVSQPNDTYEKEADSMADAVVSHSSKPDIQQKEISGIQRESMTIPLEDEKLSTAEQRMEEDNLVQEKPEKGTIEEPEEEMVNKLEDKEEDAIINNEENEEEDVLQAKGDPSGTTASAGVAKQLKNKAGKGRKLPETTRAEMESSFGRNFGDVNIHTDEDAALMNMKLGAQAFTHGSDIYFNSGKYNTDSAEGKRLLAHELTHTIQQREEINLKPEIVQLRRATWLERRAWLSFFDHYIPRMFLNNYMDDTGEPITLTEQQMQDCNPIVSVSRSPAIQAEIISLAANGGGSTNINATGWGGALTNGSLGNFTIRYEGTLIVTDNGSWVFNGTMSFYDIWDFDPKPFGSSGRSTAGEIKTRTAAAFLPGRPFTITSVSVPVSQTNDQRLASWGSDVEPVHIGDRAGRTGIDIDVGASGGVVGGLPGIDIGGELGTQSSEDLN